MLDSNEADVDTSDLTADLGDTVEESDDMFAGLGEESVAVEDDLPDLDAPVAPAPKAAAAGPPSGWCAPAPTGRSSPARPCSSI